MTTTTAATVLPARAGEALRAALTDHLDRLVPLMGDEAMDTPGGHYPADSWLLGVLNGITSLDHPEECLDLHLFLAYRYAIDECHDLSYDPDEDEDAQMMALECTETVLEALLLARLGHHELLQFTVATAPLAQGCAHGECVQCMRWAGCGAQSPQAAAPHHV